MPANINGNKRTNLSSKYAQLEYLLMVQALKNASLPFWYEKQVKISSPLLINHIQQKEVNK